MKTKEDSSLLSRRIGNALRTATCLFLTAGISPVRADVTSAQYNYDLPGDYSYAITYMPDFDQRRSGLANNGSMHCVPTSMMNLFGYAAHFGFPELTPGPGDWSHLEISIHVLNLGLLMGTSGVTGTSGTGLLQGVEDWLAASSMEAMPFVSFAKGQGYWPTLDDGAMIATQGGLVSFCFGRYAVGEGGPESIPWLTDRVSGHCVTLQRAVAISGTTLGPRELQYRDPASINDNNLGLNSPFSSVNATTAANIEIARDLDGDGAFNIYPVTSLNNPPPADGRYRVIDGFYALYPPGGMSYTEVEVAAQFSNNHLGFVQDAQPVPGVVPHEYLILGVVPHPELHSGLALLARRGGGKVLARVPHSGTPGRGHSSNHASSHVLYQDLFIPNSASALVLGYGHSVFVVGQEEILHLETPGQSAHVVARAPLPRQIAGVRIDAATYNHDTHEILLISGNRHQLFALDPATLKLKARYMLTMPFQMGAVRSLVAWDGPRSRMVIALENGQLVQAAYVSQQNGGSDGKAADYHVWRQTFGSRLILPRVSNALSVDLDNGGRLYVADKHAGLLEFNEYTSGHFHGARGWKPAAKPLYARFNLAGRKFAVFKSRSNIRPELHDTPEWNNIPADELIPLGPDIPDTAVPR